MAGDLNVESVTVWDITDTGNAEIANLPGNPDNPTAASFTPDDASWPTAVAVR